MEPPHYFEEVRFRASHRWDQLEADPDLAGPWHQLFKQVQSPRHVLSELLQNADDSGATQASVRIENGVFLFEHDGDDFQADHFASLCRFGFSNKRTLHTIGFRGIGFKSTFSLGDRVELLTPTLAVAFHRKRFTEPIWIGSDTRPESATLTRVRVPILDELRKKEIERNLDEWFSTPVSLLFFRHIRGLQISGKEIRWTPVSAGPVSGSELLERSKGDKTKQVIVIRSREEPFPQEAVEEIRQERMVGKDELESLPPCRVEIVLGAKPRLYVILPTGVETDLPFACNAPFIQDPARVQIKDPETSPTNRWLLRRIGELASAAMLDWLNNARLEAADRAAAYGLLPEIERPASSLSETCAAHVEDSFEARVQGKQFLLTVSGTLVGKKSAVFLPKPLLQVWPNQDPSQFFDLLGRPSLSGDVSLSNAKKLRKKEWIEEIERNAIIDSLRRSSPPKPDDWSQVTRFWEFLAPSFEGYSGIKDGEKLHIVPAAGKTKLLSASSLIRLRSQKILESDEDWAFLARLLRVVDPGWIEWLDGESPLQQESASERPRVEQLAKARTVLAAIGFSGSSNASDIVNRAAASLFSRSNVSLSDAVRVAHIAAKLDVAIGTAFLFATRDSRFRSVNQWVLVDAGGHVEDLAPTTWAGPQGYARWGPGEGQRTWPDGFLLHEDYHRGFRSCTRDEWDRWALSGKSRLQSFFLISQSTFNFSNHASLNSELTKRGYQAACSPTYSAPSFLIEDWDFDDALWTFWEQSSQSNPKIWQLILSHLLGQLPEYWEENKRGPNDSKLFAVVKEIARNGSQRRLITSGLSASWALPFREFPCLPDTKGFVRRPHELLRRTAQTEAFLDVEPFLAHDLDTEANRPILDLLGVRSTPLGLEAILHRLGALSGAKEPPINEVEKWYHRLDQAIRAGSTEKGDEVKAAFRQKALIFSASGTWVKSAEIFLSANEEDVPGAEVIRPAVSQLALWTRIGIAERPTVDLAIAWLRTLPVGEKPPADTLRRVRSLLTRHPVRLWDACQCWLNLAGEWVACSGLTFSLTMTALIPWKHLFLEVKRKTADLQGLNSATLAAPPFSVIPTLASRIQNRPTAHIAVGRGEAVPAWLVAVAEELARVQYTDEGVTDRVRVLANDLLATEIRRSPGLELTPYLDGVPVGSAIRAEVIWLDRTLFLNDVAESRLARLIPEEIGRFFDRADIQRALDFCYDRSPETIRSYLEENFTLIRKDQLPQTNPAPPPMTTPPSEGPLGQSPVGSPITPGEGDEVIIQFPFPAGDPPEANAPDSLPPTRPGKAPIMERFARASGFLADGDHRFLHPDGSTLVRESRNIVPWERRSPSGAVVHRYWPREHCLERDPLEIPVEVWGFLESHPDSASLVLSDLGGNPIEVTGNELVSLADAQDLAIHLASYRLVYRPGKL